MANWTALITEIETYIKQNGNKAITGDMLQGILTSMVNALGGDGQGIDYLLRLLYQESSDRANADATLQGNVGTLTTAVSTLAQFINSGYMFRGVCDASTQPSPLNGKLFFLTSSAGQYPNMGNITVRQGISVIFYDGSTWSVKLLVGIDSTPTNLSENLVRSGGVYTSLTQENARAIAAETSSAEFNSTTKKLIFKNSAGTVLYEMDATAFIIDGMVDNVYISGGNLIISFNTDAGKQDISIPLTAIFNPANYYDKTAVDALLLPITTRLAAGYIYMGLAIPSGTPDTSVGKVFYLTATAGTYTNYGNLTVNAGITILSYNGSVWSADLLVAINSTPTKNSNALVTSGGIFDNMGALDVSELNATENPHTLATYADLSAALAAIPSDYQKGGMSVKFVQSSDNNYVQYRLMSNTFNTTPANWQGVDDEPLPGSNNFVKSDGIALVEGFYVENIKYSGVITDKNRRIAVAITDDGYVIYGVGIPPQIQAHIDDINSRLSGGALYAGIATPSTNPGTPTTKVYYFAVAEGTYTNFGGITVSDGLSVLKYNGASWSKEIIYGVDDEPTPDSDNYVKSSGIALTEGYYVENSKYGVAITDKNRRICFFITKNGEVDFPVSIPASIRNYIANMIDDEPTPDSDNIVKSGGVASVEGYYVENSKYSLAVVDKNGRVVSFRDLLGFLNETIGIKTPKVYTDELQLTDDGMQKLIEDLEEGGIHPGDIPTKTSQLTNDSGFISQSGVTPSVISGNNSPVSSNGVYNAIQAAQIAAAQVTINSGLANIVIASSDAPASIKAVCTYVCDGIDDQAEINTAINVLSGLGGGRIQLTRGRFNISSPVLFRGCIELCGEGNGLALTGDRAQSANHLGTELVAAGNTDVIQVHSSPTARGYSIHDISIVGYGRTKTDNTGWGIRIRSWADIGNYYNLSIQDCFVAFGNDTKTDIFFLHDCSIQRNFMAMMIYRNSHSAIYNNIICENMGIESYTGIFLNDNEQIEKTYEVMAAIAFLDCGATFFYNNTVLRSGVIFGDTSTNPEDFVNWDTLKPIAHICASSDIEQPYGYELTIENNRMEFSNGPAIYVCSNVKNGWPTSKRILKISNNMMSYVGYYFVYKPSQTEYDSEKFASALLIYPSFSASLVNANHFLAEARNQHFVYENQADNLSNKLVYQAAYINNCISDFSQSEASAFTTRGTYSKVNNNILI